MRTEGGEELCIPCFVPWKKGGLKNKKKLVSLLTVDRVLIGSNLVG